MTKRTQILLFGLTALAGVGIGHAVTPAGDGMKGPRPPLTRAEAESRAKARFAEVDANKDGYVTKAEAEAKMAEMRGRMQARMKEMRDRHFAAMDKDRNGVLSKAEWDAPAPPLDGRHGMRGPHMGKMGMGGGMMGRAFDAMDTDRDGRVSQAEALKFADQRFERRDADKDGTIEPGERGGWRQRMM